LPQVVFFLALDFESSNRIEIRDSVRTMLVTEAKLKASAILSIRLAPGSIQVTVKLASDADVEAFNAAVVSAVSSGGLQVNSNPILQQNPDAGADTSDDTTEEDGSTGGNGAGGSASVGAAVGAVLAVVALVVAVAIFTLRGTRHQRLAGSSPSLGEAERGETPPITTRSSISSSAAMPRHVRKIIYEEAGLQTVHPSPPAPRHLYLPSPTSTNADTLSVSHDYEEMPSREEHTHLNVMYDGERRVALHNNVAYNAVAMKEARPYLQPSTPVATPYSRREEGGPGAPIYAEIDTLKLGEQLPVYRSVIDVARDPRLVYAACGEGAVAYRAAADAEGDYRLAAARPRVTPYAAEEIPALQETDAFVFEIYSDGDVSDDERAN
jgi:hypothetical protein